MNRRRVLLGLTAGIPLLAGCSTPFSTTENNTPTQSPTATVTETARATATHTTTSTATATPPSAADAWPTDTATEDGAELDLSTRETYTNDSYAYTIEYPASWAIDDTDSTSVTIGSRVGALVVEVMEDVPSSLTPEDIAPVFIEGYKESIEEEGGSVEELDRQDRALPNDHDGKMIYLRMEQAENIFQQKLLLTVANGIGYAALIMVPDTVYTSAIGTSMETILLTLTISESAVETDSSGVAV